MRNPLQQIRYLPWLPLFQVAAIATFLALVVDVLLAIGFQQVPIVQQTLVLLLSPPLGLLILLAVAFGIGVLSVSLLERWRRDVIINVGILWTLVLCVMLMLILKSLLVPAFLISTDQSSLIGIVLGVFWKGRSYWRR